MEAHHDAVKTIASQVKSFYDRKASYRIYHGSTNSTRHVTVDRTKMVDTSRLNHVLEIDIQKRTALVEPNVSMEQLVDAVLPHGLIPGVVMEFPGITVGGGVSGTAAESSSFSFGYFDSIVNWVEFVLPSGEVTRLSRSEKPDLFTGMAGSMGTFGICTLFELQMIPAGALVETSYYRTNSAQESIDMIDRLTKDPMINYLDGILMSRDHGVVIAGKLRYEAVPGTRIQRFSRASDPWFYLHAAQVTSSSTSATMIESIPVKDYLFRYDRACFWTGTYAFKYFMVPFNRITRWALDSFMKTKVMYHALHASGHSDKYILQDLVIPTRNATAFIEYVDENLGLYPLWLCPLKPVGPESMHPRASPEGDDDRSINIGVWGPGPTDSAKFVAANRALERRVRELGGMKWLYAQTFYTEDEFWRIYDRKRYDALRAKYHASHLPSIYDKVKMDVRQYGGSDGSWVSWGRETLWSVWPLSGLYGVAKTLVSKEYLLSK